MSLESELREIIISADNGDSASFEHEDAHISAEPNPGGVRVRVVYDDNAHGLPDELSDYEPQVAEAIHVVTAERFSDESTIERVLGTAIFTAKFS